METDWMQKGACQDFPPDMFFVEKGDYIGATAAKAVCEQCTVVSQCLDYALENNITEGIWGNCTPLQRAKIKRVHREQSGKQP